MLRLAFFHIMVTGEGCKDKVDRETKWTIDYSSQKELMRLALRW